MVAILQVNHKRRTRIQKMDLFTHDVVDTNFVGGKYIYVGDPNGIVSFPFYQKYTSVSQGDHVTAYSVRSETNETVKAFMEVICSASVK